MKQDSVAGASDNASTSLARRVTAFTAGCLIVSNMIGTGIFGTTGFMARDLGQPWLIMLVWACGGVFAFLGALCYAELGTSMPRAGGEYVYIREAFGPLLGFLSGWTSLTIGFSAAIAANAHLFSLHIHGLYPVLADRADAFEGIEGLLYRRETIALVMVWALTVVHIAGVGVGGFAQRALTVLKVAALALFIVAAVTFGSGSGTFSSGGSHTIPSLSVVLASFLFVSFSYSGYNAAGYIAGEMVDPRRNIPRATLGAALCVAALYLALNAIYLYALPIDQLAAEPTAPVAQKTGMALFGPAVGRWITVVLSVSILGAVSAMIWAGPRVYHAMACDGVFPRFFSRTTKKTRSPAAAILLQSVWISVLILAGGFEDLVLFAGFVLIVFTAFSAGAVLILRRRGSQESAYRVRPYPLVPIAFLILSVAVMWGAISVRPAESLWGLVTVAVGVPFYFVWRKR